MTRLNPLRVDENAGCLRSRRPPLLLPGTGAVWRTRVAAATVRRDTGAMLPTPMSSPDPAAALVMRAAALVLRMRGDDELADEFEAASHGPVSNDDLQRAVRAVPELAE